jgi:proteasome lid subunit RPN8/RPN11
MPNTGYQYVIDLLREDGSPLGQVPMTPDWEPAWEWTRFVGVRQGKLPAVMAVGPGTVEPIWHPKFGEPYVAGFRVVISGNGGGEVASEIPTAYFRGLAQQASATLVEKGALKPGELFHYLVCAFPNDPTKPSQELPQVGRFSVEEVAQPLPLEETPLEPFLSESLLWGEGHAQEGDVPIFIPQKVLDEVAVLAREAGELETGGILVGKLHRDSHVPEIFVEVTAQIPARHTHAQPTKLTFTAGTWRAVEAAIKLRSKNELMLGWWHSHPDFCKNCEPEKRKICKLSRPFFSSEDCALQRAIFVRAFNLGLLVSDRGADGLVYSLFGWRQGIIVSRGFYVRPAAAEAVSLTRGVNKHATTK